MKAYFEKKAQKLVIVFLLACLTLLGQAAAANTANKLAELNVTVNARQQLQLNLVFSQTLTTAPQSFMMKNPDRLVFDFFGVASALKKDNIAVNKMGIKDIMVINTSSRTRIIINLIAPLHYTATVNPNQPQQLNIIFLNDQKTNLKAPFDRITKSLSPGNKIMKADFKLVNGNEGDIILTLANPNVRTDITDNGNDIEITFYDTDLPKDLQNIYDVTAFDTAIENYRLTRAGRDVKLIIHNQHYYEQFALQEGNKFIVKITPQAENNRGLSDEKQHFQGENISLNFQDIPVRSVLQLLAQFTGKNIVISDAVKGNITLRLKDVPWDQALDFILKTQGLGKLESGNIIMIAPAADIAAQEQADLKARQNLNAVAPLYTQSFQINYGKVDDYYALLKDPAQTLLSSRGKVVKLANSNTLIVEDTQDKLQSIAALIKQMDVPAKQVLIEARIVYVNTGYEERLGVKWGTPPNMAASPPTQNLTGRTNAFQDLQMDLGAGALSSVGNASPATLVLGQVVGGMQLDLELQAIEAEGQGELVSSPRVMTANNQQATIQQGQQIPYQTSAPNGGTTITMISAVLQLQVTPQITPNNKLLLNLTVSQNRPQPSTLGNPNGPTIDTRQVQTNIMVNNGQTIVLGGVYERSKGNAVNRVPFLSDIPLLGNLFKSTTKTDVKTELLIFITPKIVDNANHDNK